MLLQVRLVEVRAPLASGVDVEGLDDVRGVERLLADDDVPTEGSPLAVRVILVHDAVAMGELAVEEGVVAVARQQHVGLAGDGARDGELVLLVAPTPAVELEGVARDGHDLGLLAGTVGRAAALDGALAAFIVVDDVLRLGGELGAEGLEADRVLLELEVADGALAEARRPEDGRLARLDLGGAGDGVALVGLGRGREEEGRVVDAVDASQGRLLARVLELDDELGVVADLDGPLAALREHVVQRGVRDEVVCARLHDGMH